MKPPPLWRAMLLTVPLLVAPAPAVAEEATPFDAPVLNVRPRIFLRSDEPFAGLTIRKLRERAGTPEFAGMREKWRSRPLGRAILWLLDGRAEDRATSIAGLKTWDAGGGSWSDRGPALMQMAALLDWL